MMEEQKHEYLLPDEAECERLWRTYHTPDNVQAHCRAVCSQALALGEQIKKNGYTVDMELVAAAALLHDIVRQERNHASYGAAILAREGYPAVAELVACHHDFAAAAWEQEFVLEAAIVYLADKQIRGVERVSVSERFGRSKKRCMAQKNAEEALAFHQMRWEQAKTVEQYIEQRLH